MKDFSGFPEGKLRQVPIPDIFFKELLPIIDHLGELKVSLYAFLRLERVEGTFRFLRLSDLSADRNLLDGLEGLGSTPVSALVEALDLIVQRGTLLEAEIAHPGGADKIYFLNSPRGRAALKALKSGKWQPDFSIGNLPVEISEPPNIFRLYEENIGALTPMIADSLRDAEQAFPLPWIEEAIRVSVENNKRSWRYIQAILDRWAQEGKHGKKEKSENRPDPEEARRRYVEGEYSDFIEH